MRHEQCHEQWLCDCLHLPQWMVKFHSSYELTEKDYQDGPRSSAVLPRHWNWGCGPPSETYPVGDSGRGSATRIRPGWSTWPARSPKSWAMRRSCERPGCWPSISESIVES